MFHTIRLVCIEADVNNQRLFLQHFSSSRRLARFFTATGSKFSSFRIISHIICEISNFRFVTQFLWDFSIINDFRRKFHASNFFWNCGKAQIIAESQCIFQKISRNFAKSDGWKCGKNAGVIIFFTYKITKITYTGIRNTARTKLRLSVVAAY